MQITDKIIGIRLSSTNSQNNKPLDILIERPYIIHNAGIDDASQGGIFLYSNEGYIRKPEKASSVMVTSSGLIKDIRIQGLENIEASMMIEFYKESADDRSVRMRTENTYLSLKDSLAALNVRISTANIISTVNDEFNTPKYNRIIVMNPQPGHRIDKIDIQSLANFFHVK